MTAKKAKPREVTLRFRTAYAKNFFLGQLSDGWGENVVDLKWDNRRNMEDCPIIDVCPFSDWGGEDHEIIDEESDRQRQAINRLLSEQPESPDSKGRP